MIAYDYSVWDYDYKTLDNAIQIAGLVIVSALAIGFAGGALSGVLMI